MEYAELLTKIPDEKFVEIYGSCARKIRNMLEGMFVKKSKKSKKVSLKSRGKKEKYAAQVKQGLILADDDQMIEEVLKTWFYNKRSMLKCALDFFEIENDDGITESDLDTLENASTEKLTELVSKMADEGYEIIDIAIYLAFMEVKNFDEVPELGNAFAA